MSEDDTKVQAEALAGGLKIKGEDIDFILVVKKGHAGDYPMPAKKTEEEQPGEAANTEGEGEKPPEGEGESKPKDSELSSELLADIEEVKDIKTILANQILQAELKGNAELNVETRKAELMKLKLNDLTKLLPKPAPDEQPGGGEGYATDMVLSQAPSKKKGTTGLRDIIEAGLDAGVL